MSSAGPLIRPKSSPRTNSRPLSDYRYELNNNSISPMTSPTAETKFGRVHESLSAPSQRKQRYPQPSVADDDDEEIMSNMSDSEEEDPNTLFTYKPPPANETDKCEWCAATTTHGELSLVTHDRHTKSFCSEDCQQLYKNSILNSKICEWCRQHFPKEPSLIVVEPSMESVPLQFCSQSCINKYKMELFCEEVKEQLRRIKEDKVQLPSVAPAKSSRNEKKILITPELWNKGESTVVYIDDLAVANGETPHNTGNYGNNKLTQQQSSERKRKGTKMDSVINKLSRRQFPKLEYEMEREEQIRQNRTHVNDSPEQKNTEGQSGPINLSVYRTSTYTADNSPIIQTHRQNNTTHSPAAQHQSKTQDMAAATAHKPMIVPLPIFIPMPIPIPIPTCLTALSQALLSQANPSTSQNGSTLTKRRGDTTCTSAEKRYILKQQPRSDSPE